MGTALTPVRTPMRTPVRVAAVIPARGGSKGIPRKNLRPVGGVPLVGLAAQAARAARRVDAVYCSSDDAEILAVAEAHGAAPILRPAAIAGDAASSESALLHALDVLAGAGVEPEILVFLQCTSPFTTGADIDALVAALDDDPGAACALLVAPSHAFLWRRDADGAGRGVNHDETAPRKRRQELEPEYRETGAGYAMRVPAFRASGRRFCGKVALAVSDAPPHEIDDPADLALVNALWAAGGRQAEPALGRVRALITDFDGVHTDDRVTVREDGTESVTCSRADGYGYDLLRRTDIRALILSRERNPVVAARAQKLGIEVIHGVEAKGPLLAGWLARNGLGWSDIVYVGNDLNDLECLERAGHAFVPADAHPALIGRGFAVLDRPGGAGAVRAVIDRILAARGPDGAAPASPQAE